jgi:hypothetical protein
MENDYILVKWIHETPVRCSIMQPSDISEDSARRRPAPSLIDTEVGFKWKKKVCRGLVIASGNFRILKLIHS